MLNKKKISHHTNLTAEQFANLGDGTVAYVKQILSEKAAQLFPQADGLKPGLSLFALVGAGSGLALADALAALAG